MMTATSAMTTGTRCWCDPRLSVGSDRGRQSALAARPRPRGRRQRDRRPVRAVMVGASCLATVEDATDDPGALVRQLPAAPQRPGAARWMRSSASTGSTPAACTICNGCAEREALARRGDRPTACSYSRRSTTPSSLVNLTVSPAELVGERVGARSGAAGARGAARTGVHRRRQARVAGSGVGGARSR